jgi:hypothetical protein
MREPGSLHRFLSCLVVHVSPRTRASRTPPQLAQTLPQSTPAPGAARCRGERIWDVVRTLRSRFGAGPIGKQPFMGVWEFGVLTVVLSAVVVYFLGDIDR